MTTKLLEYPCGCRMFVEVGFNSNTKQHGWVVGESGMQFEPCERHALFLVEGVTEHEEI